MHKYRQFTDSHFPLCLNEILVYRGLTETRGEFQFDFFIEWSLGGNVARTMKVKWGIQIELGKIDGKAEIDG